MPNGTVLAGWRPEVAVDGLWQDLRYGVRLVKRTPRNSAIAVAILALGIGANTAMFSAVNHLLLRPLPFPAGERLVRVRDAVTGANGQLHPFNMSARNVMAPRAHTEIFDGLVAFSGNNMTLLGAGVPERVSVVFQSEGNDETLAVTPVIGRGFSAEEQRRGLDSGVALASYALWQSHFGGSRDALGTTFRLDAREMTLATPHRARRCAVGHRRRRRRQCARLLSAGRPGGNLVLAVRSTGGERCGRTVAPDGARRSRPASTRVFRPAGDLARRQNARAVSRVVDGCVLRPIDRARAARRRMHAGAGGVRSRARDARSVWRDGVQRGPADRGDRDQDGSGRAAGRHSAAGHAPRPRADRRGRRHRIAGGGLAEPAPDRISDPDRGAGSGRPRGSGGADPDRGGRRLPGTRPLRHAAGPGRRAEERLAEDETRRGLRQDAGDAAAIVDVDGDARRAAVGERIGAFHDHRHK